MQAPNNTYIILSSARISDLKKWDLFKIDLGTSIYSMQDNNKISKVDYVVSYHATIYDKIIQKIGNAGNLLFYTDTNLNNEKIQVVKNGILTVIDWPFDIFIKSILIKLLTESEKTTIKQDYKSENENIVKNDIDIEPKVNNDVASENRKKWLEMINKTNI